MGDGLSVTEKSKLCDGVVIGLAVLHASGVIHGDVKLENVLVFASDEGEIVAKLSDFGHSILDDESRYLGTGIFNSPEIRGGILGKGSKEDYYKCDMFSYGLLVWEVVRDGRRYVDFKQKGDPIVWLNSLMKNDLLRMALLDTHEMENDQPPKVELVKKVLECTLEDDPRERANTREVLRLFSSERLVERYALMHDWSKGDANDYCCSRNTMISSFDLSSLSTLEKWSLYRTDVSVIFSC